MRSDGAVNFGAGGGEVEVHETFVGRGQDRPAKRGYMHKILMLVDRTRGEARSIVVSDKRKLEPRAGPRTAKLLGAGIALAIIATSVSAVAHVPADCHGLAVEEHRAGVAVIEALESLGKLVNSSAPMRETSLAFAAVIDRLIEYTDEGARFAECITDAE